MVWLRSNWRWVALNVFAISVLAFVLSQGSTDWNATNTFDAMLESGKWAVRFLLVSLAITPLHAYFGWGSFISLRKPAGLWAFGFAVIHVLFYVSEKSSIWLAFLIQPFLLPGLLGLLILTALAVTSNRWAMRRLKKRWKQLHRFVYLAGVATISHTILATMMSKRMAIRDPQAIHELTFYLAVLVVLLVVRIPLVRHLLKPVLTPLRARRKVDPPPVSPAKPRHVPESWPKVYDPTRKLRVAKGFTDDILEEDHEDQHVVVK